MSFGACYLLGFSFQLINVFLGEESPTPAVFVFYVSDGSLFEPSEERRPAYPCQPAGFIGLIVNGPVDRLSHVLPLRRVRLKTV